MASNNLMTWLVPLLSIFITPILVSAGGTWLVARVRERDKRATLRSDAALLEKLPESDARERLADLVAHRVNGYVDSWYRDNLVAPLTDYENAVRLLLWSYAVLLVPLPFARDFPGSGDPRQLGVVVVGASVCLAAGLLIGFLAWTYPRRRKLRGVVLGIGNVPNLFLQIVRRERDRRRHGLPRWSLADHGDQLTLF